MKVFSPREIADYYDHTEVHYRMFWKLDQSMGLHYGIWGEQTRSLAEAIVHTNERLASLGRLEAGYQVLDAGCGVGGSAIYLARQFGCHVTGITLSQRQVARATEYARKAGVDHLTLFKVMDYTATDFQDGRFDCVWAIESMQTATDKQAFFQEMARVLKGGGQLLIGDVFKHGHWHIDDTPLMQTMLHGWAMSDLLNVGEATQLAAAVGLEPMAHEDVTQAVGPSVRRIYWASLAGMVGTHWYNLFHRATHFSKVHYKTGLAQYRAWKQGLWGYHLSAFRKSENAGDQSH